MTKHLALFIMALSATTSTYSSATPYEPSDDNTVLARSIAPQSATLRALMTNGSATASKVMDAGAADSSARDYLRQAQLTGDARLAGYAQAFIAPWLVAKEAIPPRLLVTSALIKQHLHDFTGAMADLNHAIALLPNDMQAHLSRASLLQLRGDFDGAQQDCNALFSLNVLAAYACLAGSARSEADVQRAYDVLSRFLQQSSGADANIRQWALQVLATLATRRNNHDAALQAFAQAKSIGAADVTLTAEYCDVLLQQGKASEALALLNVDSLAEPLLLRKALALQALGRNSGAISNQLGSLFDAEKTRDDQRHLREEAIYQLRVLQNSDVALALARRNWQQQKEPIDTQLLLDAALQTDSQQDVDVIRTWVKQHNYYDASLLAHLGQERT